MLARAWTIAAGLCLVGVFVGGLAGCEKASHENIDKWRGTSKGPRKLVKACAAARIDPDRSAHAGANLVKKLKDQEFRKTFEAMSQTRRAQIASLLARRVWNIARIEDPKQLPIHEQ